MSDQIQHLIRTGEEAQQHFRDRGAALDDRLAAWALLGNGAAMLLCFNAALDHKICNWSAIVPFVWLFFFGLVCAFAKFVFTQRVFNEVEKSMIFMTSASRTAASLVQAKRAAMEAGQDNELSRQYDAAIETIREGRSKQIPKWLEIGSNWLLAFSVGAFGIAMFLALIGNVVPSAVCASNIQLSIG